MQSFAEKFGVKGSVLLPPRRGISARCSASSGCPRWARRSGFANNLAKTVSTAIALISNPATLGYKVMGAFGLSRLSTTAAAWSNVARQLSRR